MTDEEKLRRPGRLGEELWRLIAQFPGSSDDRLGGDSLASRQITADDLRGTGTSADFLSWLLKLQFLECALVWTPGHHEAGAAEHLLADEAAYLPTAAGKELAKQILQHPDGAAEIVRIIANQRQPVPSDVPYWDAERSQLFLNSDRVLHLSAQATRGRILWDVFQEEGWPPRVDDPLPPPENEDPAKNLREAVYRLNRRLRHGPLHFRTAECGTAVIWELKPDKKPNRSK